MEHKDIFYRACQILIHLSHEERFGGGSESDHANALKEESARLWNFHSVFEKDSLRRLSSDIVQFEHLPLSDEEVCDIVKQYRPIS